MRRLLAAVSLTAVCVCGASPVCHAYEWWGPPTWTDDFEDGDYTNNQTWLTFSSPGASRSVVSWGGDYAFRHTAPYVVAYGAGWSGAYVNVVRGDQCLLASVDTSALANDNWAAVCLLRYSPPTVAFGTGYALAINHLASGAITAQFYQINDTGYTTVTGSVPISSTYTDVWVRFLVLGTGTSTQLVGRVWPVGQAEPGSFTMDSRTTGGGSGITTAYNTGRCGVGVVATSAGVTADGYFDDITFYDNVYCVRPRW
jgi:hypothetical protein